MALLRPSRMRYEVNTTTWIFLTQTPSLTATLTPTPNQTPTPTLTLNLTPIQILTPPKILVVFLVKKKPKTLNTPKLTEWTSCDSLAWGRVVEWKISKCQKIEKSTYSTL